MGHLFDRFMVDIDIGSNPKVGRLNDRQFRCLVSGVWALAAKSDPRGFLSVAGHPAVEADVAHQARCSLTVAGSTLRHLRELGMLEFNEELGLEYCHDWDELNPTPKKDNTSAERQARYRRNLKARGLSRNIPLATKDAVFERDQGRCVVCCSILGPVEIHHRIPVVEGGDHSLENLELRCRDCHRGHAGHAVTTRNHHAQKLHVVTPGHAPEVEVEESQHHA